MDENDAAQTDTAASGEMTSSHSPAAGWPDLEFVPCVLCGGSAFDSVFNGRDRLLGLPGRFRVARCQQCGLLMTNPRPTGASLANYYPARYAVYAPDAGQQARLRIYHARLARRLDSRCRPPVDGTSPHVLDLGAADGMFLEEMRALGWNITGLEMDRGAVERASDVRGIELICASIEAASFPDRAFDLVTLSHLLEHVANPRAAIKQVRRWLRPGGSVFITAPNAASWERRLFGEYWYHWDLPRHLTHFTLTSLGRMLEEEGFRIVDRGTVTGLFLLQSLRNRLAGIRRGGRAGGKTAGRAAPGAAWKEPAETLSPTGAASTDARREALKSRAFLFLLKLGGAAGRALPGEILEVIAL